MQQHTIYCLAIKYNALFIRLTKAYCNQKTEQKTIATVIKSQREKAHIPNKLIMREY